MKKPKQEFTEQEFEEQRQKAIEAIKNLHYDHDPHFIVIVGNHDESTKFVCSCTGFVFKEIADLAVEILEK